MAQVLRAKRPRELSHRHQLSVDSVAPRKKRARTSVEPDVEPSEAPSSQRDELDASEEDHESDQNDEELHAAMLQATQAASSNSKKVSPDQNTPAECGIVEQINCINFMCHTRLTVTLGPLINFIIGHNGSGKSAVLTALTLCLGGKATATNRGQNLKSFIKSGQHFSVLSVKIRNQGSGAYKPDYYGDSITVERHFNDSGVSGFKLKDRNGKVVSTKKSELEDIIDQFGLQFDNPVTVLSQDMARQFLNDSNAKDKYKFFMKGTQLDALDRDYMHIQQELEEMRERAETLNHDVEAYRKEAARRQQQAKRAEGLNKIRAEIKSTHHQFIWAHVAGTEQEINVVESEISRISDQIGGFQKEVENASNLFARFDEGLDRAKASIEACEQELEQVRYTEKDAKVEFDEARKKLFDLKAVERQLSEAIKKSESHKKNTQSQIDDLRQAQADGGRHDQKVMELEEAKSHYETQKAAWENHDANLPPLNEALKEANEKQTQTNTALEGKRKEEKSSEAKLNHLRRGQRKWTDAYPDSEKLEALLQQIQREKRFREPPIGPVGHYVELKQPQWGPIVEKSFGAALNAFVVTSKADQSLLSRMMSTLGYHMTISIVNKTDYIDTSNNEPSRDLLTIDRALNITNNLARNYLLASNSIEQIVLIQNRQEASKLAHSAKQARMNVKAILCMSDQSRRTGFSFMPSNTGAVSMNPISEFKGSSRMEADKQQQIDDEKENLAQIRDAMNELERRFNVAKKAVKDCENAIAKHKTNKKKLQLDMSEAERDMMSLEDEVAATVPDTDQLEELEKELREFDGQWKLDQEQLQDSTSASDDASKHAKECKAKLDSANQVTQELEAKLEKCRVTTHNYTQKREQALRKKNEAIERVNEAEQDKMDQEHTRDTLRAKLDKDIETASSVCARVEVPPGATPASLSQRLETLKKNRVQMEQSLGGSAEQLTSRATEAREKYLGIQQTHKDAEALRNSLAHALNNRQERWKVFRNTIAIRASVKFTHLLSARRFGGRLQFDHKAKTLDMRVEPGSTKGGAARQTKTLSGGEKSFSTICLLLALWDAMGSPIRCLDEFDVFMDSVNREISMEMIIDAARDSVSRQYVLITPQSMSNKSIASMSDVTVIKMSDPERGQTALNFAG